MDGFSDNLERQEQDRRQPLLCAGICLVPGQEPHCEEERVGSGLFQVVAGGSVDVEQTDRGLRLGETRAQTAFLELVAEKLSQCVLLGAFPVCLEIPRTAFLCKLRSVKNRESAASGKGVFESTEICGQERDALLGVTEVEKAVAEAQVKQLALPLLETRDRAAHVILCRRTV